VDQDRDLVGPGMDEVEADAGLTNPRDTAFQPVQATDALAACP